MVTVVCIITVINPSAFLLAQPGQAICAKLGTVTGESSDEYKSLPEHLGACHWHRGPRR